jgi:peptidoglycan/xylan/chitin deacetylase (PgdA/CDA1 family)
MKSKVMASLRLPLVVVVTVGTGVLTAACGSAAGPATAPAATTQAATTMTATTTATGQVGRAARARPVPAGLGGKVWTVVPAKPKVVALTFDAGSNDRGVASILRTLRQQHVRATFFLTGNFTSAYPADARAMAAAGRIGDHSVSHPYFTKLVNDTLIRQQVQRAQATIKSVTGADPWPWFRFPYGDFNAHTISVVNSVGFVPVGWTVDTLGWKGKSKGITVAKIVNRVLASLQPGEIVLMHCGAHPKDHSTLDADALPTVIAKLRERGYQFVTLDALRGLGYQALTSAGGVFSFGAPSYGSAGALPAGVTAVGVAADPRTGGYWILKSNGGVVNRNAPWHGSLAGKVPDGQKVTAIAGSPGGGYLVLTSGGGVHDFGTRWYGSAAGRLPAGVTAIGLAADPRTGGYWILKSDGGVVDCNAPWYGSLAGKIPAGQVMTAIAGQ